ncbi:unnamed protein product [Tuber melanosporum]|uniref:(Perigord truffle) hypothetical protein n=1 Tax=Tuber melanosporum (strain Mel28) TaxID=656061 RepID=D5G7S0_TUBMM|nr:uncharacterized protein GSTUM_00004699001 [Tuber melanosporum]CAZ80563.1 unnamed protein product [Tuber melanosporum]
MDYSSTFNPLFNSATTTANNSTFANSVFDASVTIPDFTKEKKFTEWHKKQGIPAPQDYPSFANQPAPFSALRQNPNVPTAASSYIHKVSTLQPATDARASLLEADAHGGLNEPLEGRRKSTLKKTLSSSPPGSPSGHWPRNTFGSRPISRTRNRSSSMTDDQPLHAADTNAPPLLSIYDSMPFDPTPLELKPADATFTPTQVRVANFSEDRFPDLIRSLRRYYGVILEPYSGLPANESKFHDPDIVPREQLDAKTLRKTQPLAGADGGPGHWVRITFGEREAAERAVAGSAKGELVIGGRTIIITLWTEDPIIDNPLPNTSSQMDIDPPPTPLRRSSSQSLASPRSLRRLPTGFEESAPGGGEGGNVYSEHMPGAKIIVPKPVEFAKNEGWFSGLAGSLVSGPKAVVAGGQRGQGGGWSLPSVYGYVMDDLVGLKRL